MATLPLPEPGTAARPAQQGVVATFDAAVGLGTVAADGDGRQVFGFHCTEIADGTRTIDVGAQVTFVVAAAGPGVWEAKQLSPN